MLTRPSRRENATSLVRGPQWIPRRLDAPGIALAALVGALALGMIRILPPSPFISDVLVALILGALIINTKLRIPLGLARPTVEREPDRYAAGLRFTGKWVLRASIILMGFKVRTQDFGLAQFALIAGVAAASLPSAFLITHAASAAAGVRRPMADLVAGGTMICGASAVNAVAPIAGARREEQGIAIATVFLFSVVALLAFRPIAALVGLDPVHAGLWSGLAVNDLSSAIAVGKQMGEVGGAMAAASKSTRVLLLAPTLFILALLRRDTAPKDVKKSAIEQLPRYLFGYIALAVLRAAGDRIAPDAPAWRALIDADRFAVDWLMATIAAAIGLHLELRSLLSAGARAIAVGAAASCWMASLSLAMILAASRGAPATAALIAGVGLVVSYVLFRAATTALAQQRELRRRFESGAPLSLAEAMRLLDAFEAEQRLDDDVLRKILTQLHPSIGELIPVRESPLHHGEGCRWITYWEGASGWALCAVCREPGSATPIHAHSHRLLGKAIEGLLEELRFVERGDTLELLSRKVLSHNDLVETDGLATPHVVRAVGDHAAIDLQLRGPEVGSPGRRFRTNAPLDIDAIEVGAMLSTIVDIDDRPGQAGEGAKAGRLKVTG